ncbi:MAG: hypothetical protein ACJASJ_001204, partial [Candidatus Azotimanducaceae bacterium]
MLVLFDNALEPSSSAPITIAIPTPEREQGDAENEGPPQQGPNLPPLLRLTVKNGDNLSA